MQYRNLSSQDIQLLKENGCRADNWSAIEVKNDCQFDRLSGVRFEGKVKIGTLKGSFFSRNGDKIIPGIENSTLCNCDIADQIYIKNVHLLKSYQVEERVVLRNINRLSVSGETSFGNGTKIEILNEGGGRELPIFESLSSQLAYLIVLYRHEKNFIQILEKYIEEYTDSKKSTVGSIGSESIIENCNMIENVRIGSCATISGAAVLKEGTIVSNKEAPTKIGVGVIAESFIIHTGSKITDGALLDKCFIGQSVEISKQFSAENSAFFANSGGFHGEACSIFAGPYTVTHHKSSLLIAGLFSFYNAGSGTNQSNHMYKLGAIHQGVLERGSKTGSFSYILWPARVGAFTAVIGKHYSNFDTSSFPFSYVNEENGNSVLTPAMNLFSVGTRRDTEKWPKRDKRTDAEKLDIIHFKAFNPYTIGNMYNGRNLLLQLLEKAEKKQEFVSYKGIRIKRLMLKTCSKYYDLAIHIYIGEAIAERIEQNNLNWEAILEQIRALKSQSQELEQWCDISGMIAPKASIDELIDKCNNGSFNSVVDILKGLKKIESSLEQKSWEWCIRLLSQILGKTQSQIDKEDLQLVLNNWVKNKIKLNNMTLKDAEKEFDQNSRYGYGIDGDDIVKGEDFAAVRGKYEEDGFVQNLQADNEQTQARGEKLLHLIA